MTAGGAVSVARQKYQLTIERYGRQRSLTALAASTAANTAMHSATPTRATRAAVTTRAIAPSDAGRRVAMPCHTVVCASDGGKGSCTAPWSNSSASSPSFHLEGQLLSSL